MADILAWLEAHIDADESLADYEWKPKVKWRLLMLAIGLKRARDSWRARCRALEAQASSNDEHPFIWRRMFWKMVDECGAENKELRAALEQERARRESAEDLLEPSSIGRWRCGVSWEQRVYAHRAKFGGGK